MINKRYLIVELNEGSKIEENKLNLIIFFLSEKLLINYLVDYNNYNNLADLKNRFLKISNDFFKTFFLLDRNQSSIGSM